MNLPFFQAMVPNHLDILPDIKLYGIGTLLNSNRGRIERAVILGSGFGYGDKIDWNQQSVTVLGVRGPRTALALGLEDRDDLIIGDPALFLPLIDCLNTGGDLGGGRSVIAPHHKTTEAWDLASISNDELFVLDPGLTRIDDYIATIKGADLVMAESLHAAIVAAAYDVPFVPIALSCEIDRSKWGDFFDSLEVERCEHYAMPIPLRKKLRRLEVGVARGLARKGYCVERHYRGSKLPPKCVSAIRRAAGDVKLMSRNCQIRGDRRIIQKYQNRILNACNKLASMK
ncbi:polysaccharide pyruvyl transferase family protein [Haloferula sargassicola]|uniref:polysaccharide pyruvyl transferase family protein n=1 Tax=Haloferula sargassicola TaxID=490096 RepID=UPI003365AD74